MDELSDDLVIEQLSKKLRPLSDEQEANAAVALILAPENHDFSILFTKRVENPSDPWSGQIGFPGGKREPEDRNLRQNVVRETFEETGINLSSGRFLGVLPALRSAPRPGLMILPFVIFFKNRPNVKLNERELESFVWIPLRQILRNRSTARIGSREVPAFIIGDTIIWGLTYRIVESFIQAVSASR